ncbi:DUF3526 domain-containing protein, partial [Chitinophaga pinensis]
AAAEVAERKLYGQIEKQQAAIRTLQLLSPALTLQEQLAGFAGTHWHQFNQFSIAVDSFRKKTQSFYFPKMATEATYRTFNVNDAAHIPRFRQQIYADYGWMDVYSPLLIYGIINRFIDHHCLQAFTTRY